MTLEERFAKVGLKIPQILLPCDDVSLERFAVIACDQFSAEPSYWEQVKELVGASPSALHLMVPEAWLDRHEELEGEVLRCMDQYLLDGTLESLGEGMIYVRRQVGVSENGLPLYRHGLMAAIDLEKYEYEPGNHALIRATEKTVAERLPERIVIREQASLEMPHIMVLLDDPACQVSSLLEEAVRERALPRLYDFDLMQGGGHILGYRVADKAYLEQIAGILEGLLQNASDGMLMAVGDGNHSLAAAKTAWEKQKKAILQKAGHILSDAELSRYTSRYALVELVSAYDEGLSVYPIHRLLLHLSPQEKKTVEEEAGFSASHPESLQTLQPKLDAYLQAHPGVELEYIHGEDTCRRLGRQEGCLPIIFGPFDRGSIFSTVRERGLFVRKSFSLGEAREKRYYLETRRISREV